MTDILEILENGRIDWSDEHQTTTTIVTKNERLAIAEIKKLRARIVELERDFHKQCELTARTMTRVADAEGEAAMLSILLERREGALMQVDKMCDASPGFLEIQKFVRAALRKES